MARPRSVAFLPDGSRAFIPSENSGSVTVIDTKEHKALQKISLGEGTLPMGTAMSPDGKELYVTTGRGNTVAVVDTQKNARRRLNSSRQARLGDRVESGRRTKFTPQTEHRMTCR